MPKLSKNAVNRIMINTIVFDFSFEMANAVDAMTDVEIIIVVEGMKIGAHGSCLLSLVIFRS